MVFINDEESEKGYASTLSLIVSEKEELEKRINDYEIFIKNNSTSFKIGKELILEALTNFHNTFELVDKVTKKQLISSLIKRVELESDRKTIKSLVLWFEEEDNISPPPTSSFLDIPLPESELRRTVSQVNEVFLVINILIFFPQTWKVEQSSFTFFIFS